MRRHDEIRLRHMIEAAREAVSFARGRVRGDLETDRQLLLSLVKDIEIVGEAASQITNPTRKELASHPLGQYCRNAKPACPRLFQHQPRYPLEDRAGRPSKPDRPTGAGSTP